MLSLRIKQLAKVYSKSIFSGSCFFHSMTVHYTSVHTHFCSRTLYTVTTMNTKCIGKNEVEFCRKQDNQSESTIPKISVNATVTEAPFFTFWLRAPTYLILFAIFLERMMILGGFSPQLEEDIHISPSSDRLFSFAPGHFDYRRSRPSYKHLYNMCLKFEQRPCFWMVNLEIFFPIQTRVPRSNM